ncbi:Os12g0530650 [Oryza sativa Japonica Group]|uniref:Os12g0530650 protein n=1 Tax=Oryza sativa subsp. japonica TaxID=39947 RepID=A0A0P0YAT2_ORYSJ|nr:Os12g0530650 [Oryza sativa Japonica Group]
MLFESGPYHITKDIGAGIILAGFFTSTAPSLIGAQTSSGAASKMPNGDCHQHYEQTEQQWQRNLVWGRDFIDELKSEKVD